MLALQASVGNRATGVALDSVARGASAPLPGRPSFERALGADLGSVRLRAGDAVTRSALHAERADAAAVGDAILTADPDPAADVVAHELAHVVQQRRDGGAPAPPAAEREARSVASELARGRPTAIGEAAARGAPQLLAWSEGSAKPAIQHDHGFLDDGTGQIDPDKLREPNMGDYAALTKGVAQLEGAEMLRPDLVDATRGFRHFLYGQGAPLSLDYERYLRDDSSGQALIEQVLRDTRQGAIEQDNAWQADHAESPVPDHDFEMVSDVFNPPYPATENWQKAIGGHSAWITASVSVTVDNDAQTRYLSVALTLHVEDMYNFNPGAADIATGQPDSVYGRLETSGLGHEFLQSGSATRSVVFDEPLIGGAPGPSEPSEAIPPRVPHGPPEREGRPNDPRTR